MLYQYSALFANYLSIPNSRKIMIHIYFSSLTSRTICIFTIGISPISFNWPCEIMLAQDVFLSITLVQLVVIVIFLFQYKHVRANGTWHQLFIITREYMKSLSKYTMIRTHTAFDTTCSFILRVAITQSTEKLHLLLSNQINSRQINMSLYTQIVRF